MDRTARQAARNSLLGLCASGSPVVREDGIDEMLQVAWRRWQSFRRRNAKRTSDMEARIEDLAKGLRDHFEEDPRLAGPLIADYRFAAEVLAGEFSHSLKSPSGETR